MNETPTEKRRVEFEEGTENPGNKTTHPAPSTMALAIITDVVESHPAPIQRLSISIFQKFIALKNN